MSGKRKGTAVLDIAGEAARLGAKIQAADGTILVQQRGDQVHRDGRFPGSALFASDDDHVTAPLSVFGIRQRFDGQGANQQKIHRDGAAIDWLVLRNRLSNLASKNQGRMTDALTQLSSQLGFHEGPGLSERIIYRELFPSGLTLADLTEGYAEANLTPSHVAARQELRSLRILLDKERPAILAGVTQVKANLREAG